MTLSAVSVAVTSTSQLIAHPSPKVLLEATSVHVLAFSSQGDLLLVESEGTMDIDQWDAVYHEAKTVCCKPSVRDADVMDQDSNAQNLESFTKQVVEQQVEKERQWKVSK